MSLSLEEFVLIIALYYHGPALFMALHYSWPCIVHGLALFMALHCSWPCIIHGSALFMALYYPWLRVIQPPHHSLPSIRLFCMRRDLHEIFQCFHSRPAASTDAGLRKILPCGNHRHGSSEDTALRQASAQGFGRYCPAASIGAGLRKILSCGNHRRGSSEDTALRQSQICGKCRAAAPSILRRIDHAEGQDVSLHTGLSQDAYAAFPVPAGSKGIMLTGL